jgi:hypothetical protein
MLPTRSELVSQDGQGGVDRVESGTDPLPRFLVTPTHEPTV